MGSGKDERKPNRRHRLLRASNGGFGVSLKFTAATVNVPNLARNRRREHPASAAGVTLDAPRCSTQGSP
jgi:hypothetical protein